MTKRIIFTLFTVICLVSSLQVWAQDRGQIEEEKIKQLIITSYLEGLYTKRNAEAVKKGFHPEFKLPILLRDKRLFYDDLERWMSHAGVGKEFDEMTPAQQKRQTAEMEFKRIEIIGDMASVKADVFMEDKLAYTDFFNLYKFKGEWLIVAKHFYAY